MKIKRWNSTTSTWVEDAPDVYIANIVASGEPSSSNFLRGDGSWAIPTNNFVSAATFASNTLTLNREGLTALTVDLSSLATDANNFLTGVSGSGNGTVTFTRSGLTNLTWNAAHTHAIADVTNLQTNLDAKANLSGATFTGAVNIQGNKLNVGNVSGDDYIEISQYTGISAYGFTTEFSNASTISNQQGTTNQFLILGDNSTTSTTGTLLGVSILESSTYTPRLDLKGNGDLSFSGTLTGGTVPWARLSNIPSTFAPSAHTHVKADITDFAHLHGNITNAGAIGTTASLPIITTTSGVLTTGSFGTTAGTFAQGNDSRLSDARTPLSHTHDLEQVIFTTGVPTTLGNLDHLAFFDSSDSRKLKGGLQFGTSTSQFLRNDGFFAVPNPLRSITNFTAPISSNGTTAVALNVIETIAIGNRYAIEVSDDATSTNNRMLLFWTQQTSSSTSAAAGQTFTFTARSISTTTTITYKFVIHRGDNTGFRIVNAYTHTLGTGSSHPIATTTAVRVWNIYRVGG